jgi:hypothetical protein
MMTSSTRTLFAVSAAIAASTSACAGRQTVAPAMQAVSTPVHLRVSNHYGFPITVYAINAHTSTFRLGRVHPEMDSDFVVPPALVQVGPVEFVAEGSDGAPIQLGELQLSPGQWLSVTVSRPPNVSVLTVRP